MMHIEKHIVVNELVEVPDRPIVPKRGSSLLFFAIQDDIKITNDADWETQLNSR